MVKIAINFAITFIAHFYAYNKNEHCYTYNNVGNIEQQMNHKVTNSNVLSWKSTNQIHTMIICSNIICAIMCYDKQCYKQLQIKDDLWTLLLL